MTRETAPGWLQPMWIDFAQVTPQLMDRQPRAREPAPKLTNGGRTRNGCCQFDGCRVMTLGQCRMYKLYYLDRVGDVLKSNKLKTTGRPVVEKEDLPWVEGLERKRKLGEPYQTYKEFKERPRDKTPSQGMITGGGNDNMVTHAHSNRQEVSLNAVPPPGARGGATGTDRNQPCNMARTPVGFETTKQIEQAARERRAQRAAEKDAPNPYERESYYDHESESKGLGYGDEPQRAKTLCYMTQVTGLAHSGTEQREEEVSCAGAGETAEGAGVMAKGTTKGGEGAATKKAGAKPAKGAKGTERAAEAKESAKELEAKVVKQILNADAKAAASRAAGAIEGTGQGEGAAKDCSAKPGSEAPAEAEQEQRERDERREARDKERDAGITEKETKESEGKGTMAGKVSARRYSAQGKEGNEGQMEKDTKSDESEKGVKGVKGAQPTVEIEQKGKSAEGTRGSVVEGLTQYESLPNTPDSTALKTGGRGGGTGKKPEREGERKEEAPAPAGEVRVKVGDKGVADTPELAAESSNGHVTKVQNGGPERELEQAAKGATKVKIGQGLGDNNEELGECRVLLGKLEAKVKVQRKEIEAGTVKALEVAREHIQAQNQLKTQHDQALKESMELANGHLERSNLEQTNSGIAIKRQREAQSKCDQALAQQKVMKTTETTRRATVKVEADALGIIIVGIVGKIELCYAKNVGQLTEAEGGDLREVLDVLDAAQGNRDAIVTSDPSQPISAEGVGRTLKSLTNNFCRNIRTLALERREMEEGRQARLEVAGDAAGDQHEASRASREENLQAVMDEREAVTESRDEYRRQLELERTTNRMARQAGGLPAILHTRAEMERLEHLLSESLGIAQQAAGQAQTFGRGAPGGVPPRGSVQARLGGPVDHRERSRDRDHSTRQERGGSAQRSGRGTSQVRKEEAECPSMLTPSGSDESDSEPMGDMGEALIDPRYRVQTLERMEELNVRLEEVKERIADIPLARRHAAMVTARREQVGSQGMDKGAGEGQGSGNNRDTYSEGRSKAELGNKDTGSREHQQGYLNQCRCKEGRVYGVCAGDRGTDEGLGGCVLEKGVSPPLPAALSIWDNRTEKEGAKEGHGTITILGNGGDAIGTQGLTESDAVAGGQVRLEKEKEGSGSANARQEPAAQHNAGPTRQDAGQTRAEHQTELDEAGPASAAAAVETTNNGFQALANQRRGAEAEGDHRGRGKEVPLGVNQKEQASDAEVTGGKGWDDKDPEPWDDDSLADDLMVLMVWEKDQSEEGVARQEQEQETEPEAKDGTGGGEAPIQDQGASCMQATAEYESNNQGGMSLLETTLVKQEVQDEYQPVEKQAREEGEELGSVTISQSLGPLSQKMGAATDIGNKGWMNNKAGVHQREATVGGVGHQAGSVASAVVNQGPVDRVKQDLSGQGVLQAAERHINNRSNTMVPEGGLGQAYESSEEALRNEIRVGNPTNNTPDTPAYCRMIRGMAQVLDEQVADDAARGGTNWGEAKKRVQAAARAAITARASVEQEQETGESPQVHYSREHTRASVAEVGASPSKAIPEEGPAASKCEKEALAQDLANNIQGSQSIQVPQVYTPQAEADCAPAEHCPQVAEAAGFKEVGARYGRLISQAARFPAAVVGMVADTIGQTIRGAKTEGKRSRDSIGIYDRRAAAEAHLPHHGYAPPFKDEEKSVEVSVTIGDVSPTSNPSTPKKQRPPAAYHRKDHTMMVAYVRRMLEMHTPEQRFRLYYHQDAPVDRKSGVMEAKFDPSPPEMWAKERTDAEVMEGPLAERIYHDILTNAQGKEAYREWSVWKRACMDREAAKEAREVARATKKTAKAAENAVATQSIRYGQEGAPPNMDPSATGTNGNSRTGGQLRAQVKAGCYQTGDRGNQQAEGGTSTEDQGSGTGEAAYNTFGAEEYGAALQEPSATEGQQGTTGEEEELQSPGMGYESNQNSQIGEAPRVSRQGGPGSVTICTDAGHGTSMRTLTGGDAQDTITLCSQWSDVATRPGCMIDSCSAVNLIHIDHVRNLQGPRVEMTKLCLRGSTGTAPAHGEVRQGEIDLVLNWGRADAIIIRPHFYTTTNPDMRDHPLLGMPFLQALGASLHILPQEFQMQGAGARSPGYGAMEYGAAMGTRSGTARRYIPLITNPSHPDPHHGEGFLHISPHRNGGEGASNNP